MTSTSVVMYTRPNCPMCDEAREALEGALVTFEEVDVSGDQSLEDEYGRFVPVVELAGRIVFHAGMDPAELPELVTQ
jgi:glutaredoxin